MAIVKNNKITRALSGRIGNLVFRQRNGKTVVYALPRAYPPPTVAQKINRIQFAKAVSLAKLAISDETQKAFFKSIARRGQTVYHAALRYFLKKGNSEVKFIKPFSKEKKEQIQLKKSSHTHIVHPICMVNLKNDEAIFFIKDLYLNRGFP